jgi:cobalt-zinc-cadmium efflux system outer membrane protein
VNVDGSARDALLPEIDDEVGMALDATSSLDILSKLGDTSQVEGKVITFGEALGLALADNPQLIALALEIDARLAQVMQAQLKPSPELEISLSEFLGMNQRRMFRHSVSEVTYSKVVERMDKRIARMRVARVGGDTARWDYEAAVRDIQQAVARAYIEVLVAQEDLRVQRQLLILAEGLRGAVALRQEAGTVSELELSRVDLEVANARINVQQVESDLIAARKRLSAQWGDLTPDFEAVAGCIADTPLPPEAEGLLRLLPDNPYLARFAAESVERQARLELALAEARPDYTVRGGVQGFGDSGEMALTLGISIPTQRKGLNKGNIREAEVRVEQIESQRAATRLQLQAQLVDAVESLRVAYERAQLLSTDVIPAARDNVDRTVVGYRYGKFTYLDVIESERTLVQAVAAYVDALSDYQGARVDVERLIGRPLAEVTRRGAVGPPPPGDAVDDGTEAMESLVYEAEPKAELKPAILEDGNG